MYSDACNNYEENRVNNCLVNFKINDLSISEMMHCKISTSMPLF